MGQPLLTDFQVLRYIEKISPYLSLLSNIVYIKSSAGSATLGDTSWARLIIKLGPCNSLKKANLWLHLASRNFPNFLLCLESKTEPSVAKAQNYRGGTPHIHSWWVEQMGWGHRTTLKESIYWEGGTPHNIYRKSLAVGGWVGGGPSQEIIPLRGSILQAVTCQILSLAENPRWSPSVAIFSGMKTQVSKWEGLKVYFINLSVSTKDSL